MNPRLDATMSKRLMEEERGKLERYFLLWVEPLDSLEDLFYKNLGWTFSILDGLRSLGWGMNPDSGT